MTVVKRMGLLASALACMHEHGLVHQDLHPNNVLQTLDGTEWRITDFGNAAWMTQQDGTPTRLNTSMYAAADSFTVPFVQSLVLHTSWSFSCFVLPDDMTGAS